MVQEKANSKNAGVFAGGLAKRFLTRPSSFATTLHHHNQEVCIVWRCSNSGNRRVLSGCLGGEPFGLRDLRLIYYLTHAGLTSTFPFLKPIRVAVGQWLGLNSRLLSLVDQNGRSSEILRFWA